MEKEASRILREGDLDRVPFDLNDPEGYDRLADRLSAVRLDLQGRRFTS